MILSRLRVPMWYIPPNVLLNTNVQIGPQLCLVSLLVWSNDVQMKRVLQFSWPNSLVLTGKYFRYKAMLFMGYPMLWSLKIIFHDSNKLLKQKSTFFLKFNWFYSRFQQFQYFMNINKMAFAGSNLTYFHQLLLVVIDVWPIFRPMR